MADAHLNFAVSAVATAPSPATSGTSLVVGAAEGARFPAVPFNAVICPAATDPTPANAEVVRVTAISTDTFTITRAQESSTARTVVVGDRIYAGPTALTFTAIENPPACRAFNSADISHTTSGTLQVVTFDSERFDTDTMHSTSSNTGRLVATTAGLYLINATVVFAANTVGSRELRLKLNGTTYIAMDRRPTAATGSAAVSIATTYKLAATDFVEVEANQVSGGALNMVFSANMSPEFGMTRIGTG